MGHPTSPFTHHPPQKVVDIGLCQRVRILQHSFREKCVVIDIPSTENRVIFVARFLTTIMVQLAPSGPEWKGPLPTNGHLSEIDSEFAKFREEIDKNFTALWDLPMDEFKAAWLSSPVPLPDNAPQPGRDYEVLDQEAPVRDGTKIGIKIYRPLKTEPGTTLVVKAHGGGQLNEKFQV